MTAVCFLIFCFATLSTPTNPITSTLCCMKMARYYVSCINAWMTLHSAKVCPSLCLYLSTLLVAFIRSCATFWHCIVFNVLWIWFKMSNKIRYYVIIILLYLRKRATDAMGKDSLLLWDFTCSLGCWLPRCSSSRIGLSGPGSVKKLVVAAVLT
jgi:hypothetical protein